MVIMSDKYYKMYSRSPAARRGMLIVVVLVIISLLALLGTSFAFRMNADLASVNALRETQQARLAAESGVNRAIVLLREHKNDVDEWYHNREIFRRNLVWAPDEEGATDNLEDQEVVEGRPAWRFSLVSYEIQEGKTDEVKGRYGIIDEASKININVASRGQLLKYFGQFELEDVTAAELTDALIDWRDADDIPVSQSGAESSYYFSLDPSYRAKNRPFETVEELLMVKGYDGQLLYGEDFNCNGYLDHNEDDGREGTFPPDNQDGILERGFLPHMTVYSWDWNRANDNSMRININTFQFSVLLDSEKAAEMNLPDYLTEDISTAVVEFIAEAQKRGYKFRSIGELLGLEVFEDGSTNYDELWKNYEKQIKAEDNLGLEIEEEKEEAIEQEQDPNEAEQPEKLENQPDGVKEDETGELREENESGNKYDTVDEEDKEDQEEGNTSGRGGLGGKYGRNNKAIKDDEGNRAREARTPRTPGRTPGRLRGASSRAPATSGGSRTGKEESSTPTPPGKKKEKGTPVVSPVTTEDMRVLLDRLTVDNKPILKGLINVNTASKKVLSTVAGLTEQEAESIVSQRKQVHGDDKKTTAWLVTGGILDYEKFALVSNSLTSRSSQFTIDSIGFADHVGATCRLRVVIEMRGHLSQIKYYRDITSLGVGYPVKDDEGSKGFAFLDR